jgi:hypothetical protein
MANGEKLQIRTITTNSTSLLGVAEQRAGIVALKMYTGAFHP